MNNVILSTTSIEGLTNDIANEVIRKLELWGFSPKNNQRRIVGLEGLTETFPEIGSKSTIYKLTSSGDIPHFKRNGKLLFDLDLIEEWAYPLETK